MSVNKWKRQRMQHIILRFTEVNCKNDLKRIGVKYWLINLFWACQVILKKKYATILSGTSKTVTTLQVSALSSSEQDYPQDLLLE